MYMKHMVFANDLWLFIGRFKTTPIPTHLDRTLTKKVIFCHFLGLLTPPPPPYGGKGGNLLTRGCRLQKYFCSVLEILFNNIFFTTYCKEYQLFTQTKNCIIITNVKTLDRFYCKERKTLTDFWIPLLFRLGLSNSFFFKW